MLSQHKSCKVARIIFKKIRKKVVVVRVSILASGSTGNTSLIETEQHKVLMDAGLSGKKIKSLLAEIGVDINEIDMVFLSHDHSDHSKGLGVLLRRYPQIAAFTNSGTWQYLDRTQKIGKLPVEQINMIESGQTKTFGDLEVTAFATSHDAAEPQYYVFTSGGKRMAFLTDTGYVSQRVKSVITDADAYLMEFNYDDMMLRNGPYSWALKQRILSDVGHLSNVEAGEALLDVISSKTEHIFLAHRSQHNNTAKLAYQAAKQILVNGDACLPSDVKIMMTNSDVPTDLIQI
jgi:phosphoribosyl 1,2-cyclic phosphodiesterase